MQPLMPVDALPLLRPLHDELMTLLRSLTPRQWEAPTACPRWTVHDIAAHLLDTGLRRLSLDRDRHQPPPPQPPIQSPSDLVAFLDRLNAVWVDAARRISPNLLIALQDFVGPQVNAYWASLDPNSLAHFSVGWAGEAQSAVWFDGAREYTERWHHQQQIRDAVNAPGLTDRHWLHPVLDTFVRALPFTYRDVPSSIGATVNLDITGPAGGQWALQHASGSWQLLRGHSLAPDAAISIDAGDAWRLFTKGLSPEEAARRTALSGDHRLTAPFLRTLAVMAVREPSYHPGETPGTL